MGSSEYMIKNNMYTLRDAHSPCIMRWSFMISYELRTEPVEDIRSLPIVLPGLAIYISQPERTLGSTHRVSAPRRIFCCFILFSFLPRDVSENTLPGQPL